MAKLPLHLQIPMFKRRFEELNAPLASDLIDWKFELGKRETFDENLETLKNVFPMYVWEPKEKITARSYTKEVVSGIEGEASAYGYTLIKKHILNKLKRGVCPPKRGRVRKPRKTCPPSEKIKVTFLRCP